MAEYNHRDVEPKWQAYWTKEETFKATKDTSKPKFYALDMFPYPSGAGLHVSSIGLYCQWYCLSIQEKPRF